MDTSYDTDLVAAMQREKRHRNQRVARRFAPVWAGWQQCLLLTSFFCAIFCRKKNLKRRFDCAKSLSFVRTRWGFGLILAPANGRGCIIREEKH